MLPKEGCHPLLPTYTKQWAGVEARRQTCLQQKMMAVDNLCGSLQDGVFQLTLG